MKLALELFALLIVFVCLSTAIRNALLLRFHLSDDSSRLHRVVTRMKRAA